MPVSYRCIIDVTSVGYRRVIVPPVEAAFLAKVATMLTSVVVAPMEQPPSGRLYVICKGSARYRGSVRAPGFCWHHACGTNPRTLPRMAGGAPLLT